MRTLCLFNDDWLFAPPQLDLTAPDDGCEPVVLPHTNRLFTHRTVDSAAYQFVSTYRKRFCLPEARAGRRVFLDFDGAMAASTVYLNGQRLGEHLGGFTPFSFDLTPHLAEGENVITVILDSTERPDIPPFGGLVDYLTFGGIYRDVWLRMVEPCHIQDVFARPGHVLTAPTLACDYRLSEARPGLCLEAMLTDADGQIVACVQEMATFCQDAPGPIGGTLDFPAPLPVDLWSLETPTLYTLALTLLDGETPLDTVRTRIGFREAGFRADGRFALNGQPLKLMGLNRHQTYPYIGAAAPARLQRKDADILKFELGCNIVRTSHYPQSPHFLDRCDEIGLLVFEEIPGWQHIGDEAWQSLVLRDVQAMIERDRSRPSVVLWGVRINESPDHHDLYAQTNALAHRLDPTRQTGGVRNFITSEFLEDVFTYNDFSNTVIDPIHQPHLITEFAGHMFPTKSWDQEERRIQHALLHARVQNLQWGSDRVAGAIGWCAFDYSTHREFGSGDRICHHGVMDSFRLPKWAAYLYQSQRPPEQGVVLQAATLWTLGDRSGGGNNPLTVFSNCDEIEVFIGAHRLGRCQPDRATFGHLPHPPFILHWPGEYDPWGQPHDDLRIIGYIKGRAAAEQRIAADGAPHALILAPDDTILRADGADMTRLAVRITDRYGNTLPYWVCAVQVEIEGDATLIGENPLPLVGGQAALYIRAGRRAGPVTIWASAAGMFTACATLMIETGIPLPAHTPMNKESTL